MRIRVIQLQKVKSSRGYEVTHAHSGYSITKSTKDARFFTESIDIHAIKTALKVSCIF